MKQKIRSILFLILILFNFNFTFGESIPPSIKEIVDKDVVKNLNASVSSDNISIELKWTEPVEEGDLIIARSNEIIDSYEKLGVSDSLGKYSSSKTKPFNSFQDINLKAGNYYYAIVLVSQVKKKKVKLFPNVNFTTNPIVILPKKNQAEVVAEIEEVKHEISSVTNLKIRKQDNTLRLTWTPPLEAEYTDPVYTIYKSPDPLNKKGMFDNAEKIAELQHPETTYLDEKLTKSETVYYGVTVSLKNKEYFDLEENKSYRKFFFTYTEPVPEVIAEKIKEEKRELKFKGPLRISNIKYEKRKDGILITWSPPEGAIPNSTLYTIYESETSMSGDKNSLTDNKAKKVGTVAHPDLIFLHPILDFNQDLFYGVTVTQKDFDEDKVLVENISFIKVDKRKKKKKIENNQNLINDKKNEVVEVESPDFDNIYKNYFKKNKFNTSYKKFITLSEKTNDANLKGKSLFFAALSKYSLKQYEKALKILLKDAVQLNYDKERVDFYTKRCLEKGK